MLRWILLLVAIVAFGMALRTDSPGLLATTLLVGFVAVVGGFFGFVAARVDNVAQGQNSREIQLLMAARKRGSVPGEGAPGAIVATSVGSARDPEASDGGGDGGSGDSGGGSDGGGGGN